MLYNGDCLELLKTLDAESIDAVITDPPYGLFERELKYDQFLLRASTREGDLVLVLFGGAGSEVAVCHEMGRRWLTAEIDPVYADLIRKRVALGRIPDEYRWRPVHRVQPELCCISDDAAP